jgi:alpha-tubulin suppressor-like RCC1 family protein
MASGFAQVALGEYHAAAVKSDGTLWTWGWNQDGQLGVGDTQPHAGMQSIGNGYVSVAATFTSTLALKTDGTLWAWGQTTPPTGNGPAAPTSPQQIGTGFVSASGGPTSVLALKGDGSIWGWGYGPRAKWFGYTPVHVGDGFVQVAAGDSEWLALKADGTAWALSDDAPPLMVQIASNVQQVASNGDLAMLLSKDGTLWTWRGDFYGDLGNGTTASLTPVPQRIATNITAIAAGYGFAAAVDANGNVLAWGSTGVTWPGTETTRAPAIIHF